MCYCQVPNFTNLFHKIFIKCRCAWVRLASEKKPYNTTQIRWPTRERHCVWWRVFVYSMASICLCLCCEYVRPCEWNVPHRGKRSNRKEIVNEYKVQRMRTENWRIFAEGKFYFFRPICITYSKHGGQVTIWIHLSISSTQDNRSNRTE